MYNIHRSADRLKEFDSSLFQDIFYRKQRLINPVDLSIGLPGGPTPQYIKDAGISAIQDGHTSYTSANGMPSLRKAIADKLRQDNNIEASEETVTIVPGLTTGLLITYLALLNPGDEVMIMDPSYPSYHYLVPIAEARLVRVPTLDTFQLDFDAITSHISPSTRMIIVNTPNNPTGAIYPKEDLIKLAGIAKEHDIMIISDEMYESFAYEHEHFSIGSIYPNTLTMNGFSKTYSMTGWRLGYIAGPRWAIDAINQLQQYAIFSSSSIAQHAALEALRRPVPMRTDYIEKRNLVHDRLTHAGYDVQGNAGAYYTFFKTPNGMDDLEFIELAAEHNLLLLPGRAFSDQETYARLSYGGIIKDIEKGLAIITEITQQVK